MVDLDELEASDAKRTQGEWTQTMGEASKIVIEKGEEYLHVASTRRPGGSAAKRHADASHIVKVVNAAPAMIAELRGLRGALHRWEHGTQTNNDVNNGIMAAHEEVRSILNRTALDATKKRGLT